MEEMLSFMDQKGQVKGNYYFQYNFLYIKIICKDQEK